MDRNTLRAQLRGFKARYRLWFFALGWAVRWVRLIGGYEMHERGKAVTKWRLPPPQGRPKIRERDTVPTIMAIYLHMEQYGCSLRAAATAMGVSRQWFYRILWLSQEGEQPSWIARHYTHLTSRPCDGCNRRIPRGDLCRDEDMFLCARCHRAWRKEG